MPSFEFKKEERLKSRKVISQLFKTGSSFNNYPLRIIWVENDYPDLAFPIQFCVSVPKRKFPKAAHRNVLRRRIREAYRLTKNEVYQELNDVPKKYAVMVMYVAKEELPYSEIEQALQKTMKRWLKKVLD